MTGLNMSCQMAGPTVIQHENKAVRWGKEHHMTGTAATGKTSDSMSVSKAEKTRPFPSDLLCRIGNSAEISCISFMFA